MKKYLQYTLYFLFAALLAGSVNAAHNNGIQVFFAPSGGSSDKPPKLLHITATVDGSEKISFTTEDVHDQHIAWKSMTDVTFDGKPWTELDQTPVSWLGIGDQLDLSKAHIVKREGRDVIALEAKPEGFDLYLVDSPNGASHYEVTIAIPYRK